MMVIKIKKYNKKKKKEKSSRLLQKKIYRKCLNGKIARSIWNFKT